MRIQYTFEIPYAPNKDAIKEGDCGNQSMTVNVEETNYTAASLLAEQMVAAIGREPMGRVQLTDMHVI